MLVKPFSYRFRRFGETHKNSYFSLAGIAPGLVDHLAQLFDTLVIFDTTPEPLNLLVRMPPALLAA